MVDAGEPALDLGSEAAGKSFPLRHLTGVEASSAGQRNRGIAAVPADVDLVGFADDDSAFAPSAWARMLDFWRSAPADLGGAGFNMLNHPEPRWTTLKGTWLFERLGLFTGRPGGVPPSGWGTLSGRVERVRAVEWLPATAVLWRSEVTETERFDEGLGAYSLLEDLDFSYRAARRWRLAVVPDAFYWHLPAAGGRPGGREFGRLEVRNRLRFVRKAGLSEPRCWAALLLRAMASGLLSLYRWDMDLLLRSIGNLERMRTELSEHLASDPSARR